jgi:hypothetical protein
MKCDYVSFINFRKKLILYLLRYRCKICFNPFENNARISVLDRFYSEKKFTILDKSPKKTEMPIQSTVKIPISDRDIDAPAFTKEILFLNKNNQAGRVIAIEFFCKKCGYVATKEIDLDQLFGNNFSK